MELRSARGEPIGAVEHQQMQVDVQAEPKRWMNVTTPVSASAPAPAPARSPARRFAAVDSARITTPSTRVNRSGLAAKSRRSGQGNDSTH